MASRAGYSVVLHTLGSIELLARQAVTAASPSRTAVWASTSRASQHLPSSAARVPEATRALSLRRANPALPQPSPAATPSKTGCRKDDDAAARLGRMLFKQDTRSTATTKIPRRIARMYSRRPLLRQLESLRLSASPTSSSTASCMRPFFTSAFRSYSTNANPDSTTAESDTNKSGLMGKLKDLTRKYGWATVVVYLIFSAVDFGLCFFLINLVGAEHVRKGQDYVLDALVYGTTKREDVLAQAGEQKGNGILGFLKNWRQKHKLEDVENENDSKRSGTSGIWATAVLAYGIHKTLLLPVRLGLTAAATPAIVKYLQRFGLNIARTPIPDSVKKRGAESIKSGRARLDKAREKHRDWL